MPLAPLTPQIDFRLAYKLRRVAGYLRAIRFHRHGILLWSGVSLSAAALLLVQLRVPALAHLAAPALLVVFVCATIVAVVLLWRDRTSLHDAARYIGNHHPEARSALDAAVEQLPEADGQFHFLQRRVINDALRHADSTNWYRRPRFASARLLVLHLFAMLAALACSLLVLRAHRPAAASPSRSAPLIGELEITPGDVELERGSAVVIAARFPANAVPSSATLVTQRAGAPAQRASMHRSLSDPVFAFTLPNVADDTAYHIEYDSERTRTFALTVFDRPALVRADAILRYPDYTGLAERHLPDTRRLSAVTGTSLIYDFNLNKPVARAVLRAADSSEVLLELASDDRTRFRLATTIERSARYTLHLVDDAGRTNAAPNDIRIEAIENRRPELKLVFPRGDQRVSPIEELHLQAEARDDFGLQDFGIGLSIADTPPNFLSLSTKDAQASSSAGRTLDAQLSHLLALEQHNVEPDQLVTWFAWADDVGPDGQIRRTTSDIFFAEIRSLDEIFREDANGGGRNQAAGGGGGPGDDLIETQRQISIAIWKLRQQETTTSSFRTDAETLRDSQQQARRQLEELRERLEEPSARAAADEAAPLMQAAADSLSEVASTSDASKLNAAWSSARSAYQSLLRMQPRDTRVSQPQSGQGSGGRQRSREQLNELEFRDAEDRYETETSATPPPTPEEREQLQVLARLRELARRQQDVNRRLQELQTALAAAEDEAQREAIRRELKRLEDEQRRMVSELDETRQRVDRLQPGQQTQQARDQLDQTRDDMRRATEQLEQGEISQALAAGSRVEENLQRTSEDLRQQAAGRFGEQMREARRQARELTENQKETMNEFDELARGPQSLDDSEARESLAQRLDEQAQRREQLLEALRQVTEDSEASEPRLHRQLYDLLRQQNQSGAGRDLATSAEMLRRGFLEPARDQQQPVARDLEQLQRGVERAAGAVLGDELNELRFAERELEELARDLRREQQAGRSQSDAESQPAPPGGPASEPAEPPSRSSESVEASNSSPLASASTSTTPPSDSEAASRSDPANTSSNPSDTSSGGADGEGTLSDLEQLARSFGNSGRSSDTARGPLTGANFGEWADRLRTVEELVDSPELRRSLAGARTQAEEMRRVNHRNGKAPQWDMVELSIVKPLEDARAWLRQELSRRENPDALQPIDRDPVPERFAESVRKYYEALGQ